MTAPPEVIEKLAGHPLTASGLATFMKDAEAAGIKIV
jgi:transaldolase